MRTERKTVSPSQIKTNGASTLCNMLEFGTTSSPGSLTMGTEDRLVATEPDEPLGDPMLPEKG
jgi:hypothetical protein